MARDPRKMSAYESGMRGSQKPKISGNSKADAGSSQPDGGSGSESRQSGGATVGHPGGVGLDAYTSGMRGMEKPKQKSSDAATKATGNAGGAGSSKQGAGTSVGNPKGDPAGQALGKSMDDSSLESHSSDAYSQEQNSSERASMGMEPTCEEDDTHLNIRIPKASVKRKAAGLHGN